MPGIFTDVSQASISETILYVDSHLVRHAQLETLTLLRTLYQTVQSLEQKRLLNQALVRLTYSLLHSSIRDLDRSEILLLNRFHMQALRLDQLRERTQELATNRSLIL